jgi:hypothetical protein
MLSEPVELSLETKQFVYRLWAEDGTCLYVGQHKGFHPSVRVAQHHNKDWWPEVARADYVEVDGNLDHAETEQIRQLSPKHNRRPGRVTAPGLLTAHTVAKICGVSRPTWIRIAESNDVPVVTTDGYLPGYRPANVAKLLGVTEKELENVS